MNIGSVLGAGSVLTRNTEPYGVYVGNPARLLHSRFDHGLVKDLIASNWWDLPPTVLFGLNFSNPKLFLEELNELGRS